jgi:Uma2 family endonuclease
MDVRTEITATGVLEQAVLGSDEALFALSSQCPDLRIERAPGGAILIMNPTKPSTGRRNSQLIVALGNWANADNTGLTFDSSTGWKLPSGAVRSPDASWLRKERWEALTPAEQDTFSPLCPDFVIELLSDPKDLASDQAKMAEYMEAGARLGWLIEPFARQVHVYRPGKNTEIVENPEFVDGDPELPGFALQLAKIW